MVVTGVDYVSLASSGLVGDFVAVCRRVVSAEASVDPQSVAMEVSAGSVLVSGTISVPSASSADATLATLRTSTTLGTDLASEISGISGISAATDGSGISVANIQVTSSATALTTLTDSETSTTRVLPDTLEQIQESEATAVQQLLASNKTTVYVAASNDSAAVASVGVLFRKDTILDNQSLMVTAPDVAGSEVSLPESVLDHLGTDQAIVVVTVVVVETVEELDKTSGSEVQQAVSVNIFNATSGAMLDVTGLPEPIVILFPNGTGRMECAFFDEEVDAWSTAGMGTELQTDGWLRCTTTHLTIFGAIIRGFAQTFVCSQVYLLSAESYREVLAGDWTGQACSIVLFVGTAVLALLLAAAAALDARERRLGLLSWRAEHFLIEPEQLAALGSTSTANLGASAPGEQAGEAEAAPRPDAEPPAAHHSASAASATHGAPSVQAGASQAEQAAEAGKKPAGPLQAALSAPPPEAAAQVSGEAAAISVPLATLVATEKPRTPPEQNDAEAGQDNNEQMAGRISDATNFEMRHQAPPPPRRDEEAGQNDEASAHLSAGGGRDFGAAAADASTAASASRSGGSPQQAPPERTQSVGDEDRLDKSEAAAGAASAAPTAPGGQSSLLWLFRFRGSQDSLGSQSYYTVGKSAASEALSEAAMFGRSEMIAVILGNLLAYFDEVYNVAMTLWEHLEESWEEGGTRSLEKAALGLLASSTARQASASLFMHPHDAQFLLQAAEAQAPCAEEEAEPADGDGDGGQPAFTYLVDEDGDGVAQLESKKSPERPSVGASTASTGSGLNRRRCCCCLLRRRRRRRTWSGDSKSLMSLADSSPNAQVPEHMEGLRSQLSAKRVKFADRHARWRSLPRIVLRSFVLQGPIGASFSQSILMSRSMRVLFLTSELLGGFMIETLMFEASGETLRKTAPEECSSDCEEMGRDHCFWEEVGYYIAVGVVSALVAGIPVALMGALHKRDLKRVKNQRHKQFQLRLWWIQDAILWVIGVCYCLFAINYITLFFANVSGDDLGDWYVGATTVLLMDFAVVPFLVSLSVPLLALSILSVLSCSHRMPKHAVVQERLAARLSVQGVKSADTPESTDGQPTPDEHAAVDGASSSGAVGNEPTTQGPDTAAPEESNLEPVHQAASQEPAEGSERAAAQQAGPPFPSENDLDAGRCPSSRRHPAKVSL